MPVEQGQPTPQTQPQQEEQPQGEPSQEGGPSIEQVLQSVTEAQEIPIKDKLNIALDWLLDITDLNPNSPQLLMELVSKDEDAKGLFSQLFQQTDDITLLEQPQEEQPQ